MAKSVSKFAKSNWGLGVTGQIGKSGNKEVEMKRRK
jgi:nicotinamide mononucleotide (NMN) deamidase PncC